MKRSVLAVEMDYLRRSAGISSWYIWQIMEADRFERQALRWFGHVLRMSEDRWPVFEWAMKKKWHLGTYERKMHGIGRSGRGKRDDGTWL